MDMKKFSRDLLKEAFELLKIFNKNGKTWITGGALRNYYLDRFTNDFDFATTLSPSEIQQIELPGFEGPISNGDLGGFLYRNNRIQIDITGLRVEEYDLKSRKPNKVSFSNKVYDDVKRRDFTINSLYMNQNGEILDLVNGVQDLDNRILRCVGLADKKFKEDPLRMLRAIRFVLFYDLDFEDNTRKALVENYQLIYNISSERRYKEFYKIIEGVGWGGLKIFVELGLLKKCFDRSYGLYEFNYKKKMESPLLSLDLLDFCIRSSENFCGVLDLYVYFGNLFGLDWKEGREFLYIRDLLDKGVDDLASFIDFSFAQYDENFLFSLSKIFLSNTAKFSELQSVYKIDKLSEILHNIEYKDLPKRMREMDINGEDLLALGYKGKEVGKILGDLFLKVVQDEENNNKENLLAMISDGFRQ